MIAGRAICIAALSTVVMLVGCGSGDDSGTTAGVTAQRPREGFQQTDWVYGCVNAKTPPFCTGNQWPDLQIQVDSEGEGNSQIFDDFGVTCPRQGRFAFRVDDGENPSIIDNKFKVEGVWYHGGRSIGKAGVVSGTQSADQKSMTVSWMSGDSPCIASADGQALTRTSPPS